MSLFQDARKQKNCYLALLPQHRTFNTSRSGDGGKEFRKERLIFIEGSKIETLLAEERVAGCHRRQPKS
jgi:hypothetical protein